MKILFSILQIKVLTCLVLKEEITGAVGQEPNLNIDALLSFMHIIKSKHASKMYAFILFYFSKKA